MTAPAPQRSQPRQRPLAGPDLPPFAPWVPADRGIPLSRSVRLTDLSGRKMRKVWSWLRRTAPATVALLAGPDVQSILRAFPGASPVLDIDTVSEALK